MYSCFAGGSHCAIGSDRGYVKPSVAESNQEGWSKVTVRKTLPQGGSDLYIRRLKWSAVP